MNRRWAIVCGALVATSAFLLVMSRQPASQAHGATTAETPAAF